MRLTQTGFDDESRRFRRIAEIWFVVLLIDVIEKFLKLKTIELKVGFNLVAAVFFLIGKTAGKLLAPTLTFNWLNNATLPLVLTAADILNSPSG